MDELYALLKESVKLRLISDVPLGAFLSGGIDSSTIVGLMRELGASPLRTFSIGFKDASYNELDHARRIARAVRRPTTKSSSSNPGPSSSRKSSSVTSTNRSAIFRSSRPISSRRWPGRTSRSSSPGTAGMRSSPATSTTRRSGSPGCPSSRPGQAGRRRSRAGSGPASKKKGAWNKLRRFTQGIR